MTQTLLTQRLQESECTALNRYPEIFSRAVASLTRRCRDDKPGAILSFGCSTGEEVRTLKAMAKDCNSDWLIHGVEIVEDRLAEARRADPEGTYVSSISSLPLTSYDLVFCMSVLCRFPDNADDQEQPPPRLPFSLFESAARDIDSVVCDQGGVLVIWNASYDFRDTSVAHKYVAVDDLSNGLDASGFAPDACLPAPGQHVGSGFVPKYRPDGSKMEATVAVPLAFKKQVGPTF